MHIGPPADHYPRHSLHQGRSAKLCLHGDLVECLDHPARPRPTNGPSGQAAQAPPAAMPDPISP